MKVLVKTKLIEIEGKKFLEIRDFELGKDLKVIHCKDQDYKKCLHLKEEYMILTVSKQKEGKVINTQRSMFPPYATYRLVRFVWKEKGINEVEQVQDKGEFEIKDGKYIARL